MSLFTVQLVLSTQDKARFERIAGALEALVAKVSEPGAEVPPELHDEIGQTAQAAADVKDALTPQP